MNILTEEQATDVLAFERADGTRKARLHSLREGFVGFGVGRIAVLSDEDLSLWHKDLPTIVNAQKIGADGKLPKLDKAAQKIVSGINGALQREVQAALGNENARTSCGFRKMDGKIVYSVKRTK